MTFIVKTARLCFRLLLAAGILSAQAAMAASPAPAPAAKSPLNDPEYFARHLYPLSKPLRTPKVVIDVSDSPESRAWAEQAKKLTEEWYPHLTQILATEDFKPKKTLKLIFKKGIGPPAYASDGNITIKAEWIAAHPDDFGMVIHELTHVIQSYPGGQGRIKPGWLVEGIADYVRWWRYEPEAPRTPVDPEKASYRDSYRTTAWFLAYVTGRYNRTLVYQLDRALRNGTYSDELFQKIAGKPLDDLWKEFAATHPPRRTAAP